MVDDVVKVDVPVVEEIGMEDEAEKPEVPPTSDLVTEVDERLRARDTVLHLPDTPAPFPYEHSPIARERDTDCLIPRPTHRLLDKSRR